MMSSTWMASRPVLTAIKQLAAAVVLGLVAASLGGCGSGGAGASQVSSTTGSARILIHWPAPTRLIPDATQSIKVDIHNVSTGAIVASQVVNRPPGQTTSTVVFPNLPVTSQTVKYYVAATAYPLPGAQGTPVAAGQTSADMPLTITQDVATPISLTLNSTITHIDLVPLSGSLQIVSNQVITLVATARDASGGAVLVAPQDLQFVSSNPAVASVTPVLNSSNNPTGMVSVRGGSTPGTAQITVTDFESGGGQLAGQLVASGSAAITVATANGSGSARFVFVANRGTNNVASFTVDPNNGLLTPTVSAPPGEANPAAAGSAPQSVVVDPTGRFVYVVNNGSSGASPSISAFSINQLTGNLHPFPAVVAPTFTGTTPTAVAIDPTGQFLYLLDSSRGTLTVFSIDPGSGALTNPNPTSTGVNPQGLAISPSGNVALVANTGENSVGVYSVNGGVLSSPATFSTGSNPQSVTVDASGSYVYVANSGSSDVSAYFLSSNPGSPPTLFPIAGPSPTGTFVDPGGRGAFAIASTGSYVFVANRDTNNISVFIINRNTGELTLAPGSPFPAGSAPETISLDPTGRFLYVGNLVSNNTSIYTINLSTGALSPAAGSPFATGSGPSSIALTRGASGSATLTAQ